jgi:hypothetical protein
MNTNSGIHDYLYDHLGSAAHILEIGSGKGTYALVDLFREITCIEHDLEYVGVVPGATYIHAPLVPYQNSYFRDATLWYDTDALASVPSADAIIIDGPKGSQGRGGFLTHLDLFDTKALLLFDDIHRMWEFRLMGCVAQKLHRTALVYPGDSGRRWFGVVDGR